MLVMVYYATQYLKAIPLQMVTGPWAAEELMK